MPRKRNLTVVTYNIHKGLSQFNKRLVLHGIKEGLKALEARGGPIHKLDVRDPAEYA